MQVRLDGAGRFQLNGTNGGAGSVVDFTPGPTLFALKRAQVLRSSQTWGGQKSGFPLTSKRGRKRLFMNSRTLTFRLWIIGTVFMPIFCLSSCDSAVSPVSKLTRANFDQIHEKMSKEEVKAILGSPSSSSTEDKLIYKRTTWRYVEGDKYINITFKNDELDSKDTNLGTG
jgi:hypothetical protein